MELQTSEDKIPIPTINEDTSKLCQSCIERGYAEPNIATKAWINGYYICEDCYQPLLNNLLSFPNHFSDIITSEQILQNRDEIFNFHHTAIVNKSKDEVEQMLENYKKILFTIRIFAEDSTDYINKCKVEERKKLGLESPAIAKSRIEKDKKPSIGKGLAKSKESKLKETMAKTLGISVLQLEEMGAKARQSEFQGILDNKPQSIVSQPENIIEAPKIKKCPLCGLETTSLLKHYSTCPKRNKDA